MTQATETADRPKVVERLFTWAGLLTLFAWIGGGIGVLSGLNLMVGSSRQDSGEAFALLGTIGMGVIVASVTISLLLGMLAAWARAWAEWATETRS